MSTALTTTTPIKLGRFTQPEVTGTWDGARKHLASAVTCEALKLFCQVMIGYELIAIKIKDGVTHGGPRTGLAADDVKASSKDWNLPWTERVEKELGIKYSTANLFENMARAYAAKLKKFPELKDFDVLVTPIGELSEKKRGILVDSVKKATDAKTQAEFCQENGLWKKPAGSTGRAQGEGGRKKLTLAEQAELLKLQAAEDFKAIAQRLSVYADKFTALTDAEIEAQIALLEVDLSARKAWLKQPKDRRDPKAIKAMLH